MSNQFKTLGRVVSRGGSLSGLFLPIGSGLSTGIWEVREILGALTLVYLGQPAMKLDRLKGLSIGEVYEERRACGMTVEELSSLFPPTSKSRIHSKTQPEKQL